MKNQKKPKTESKRGKCMIDKLKKMIIFMCVISNQPLKLLDLLMQTICSEGITDEKIDLANLKKPYFFILVHILLFHRLIGHMLFQKIDCHLSFF